MFFQLKLKLLLSKPYKLEIAQRTTDVVWRNDNVVGRQPSLGGGGSLGKCGHNTENHNRYGGRRSVKNKDGLFKGQNHIKTKIKNIYY